MLFEFLQNNSLEELYSEHGIRYRIHDYKVSLNYDQLEAKEGEIISQMCRGLVLRKENKLPIKENELFGEAKILGRGFDRFFNFGQQFAAEVPLSSKEAKIYEKADGTFIIVYWDDVKYEWCIATRAVPEADVPINGWENFTFSSLFKETIKKITGLTFFSWSSTLSKDKSYLFELCTPYNQVVVKHKTFNAFLLGVRSNNIYGTEFFPEEFGYLNVPIIPSYKLNDIFDILNFVRNRDPYQYEGVVVCDRNFNRIKIKNIGYLALSKIKEASASPRNIMTLILEEKIDDAYAVMTDEIKEKAIKMKDGIQQIISKFDSQYNEIYSSIDENLEKKEHRKQFAIAAKKRDIWFEAAMAKYAGHCSSVKEYVLSKKDKSGNYSNSFLDKLIQMTAEGNI